MRACIERARQAGEALPREAAGVFRFRFAASEAVFKGHFPGKPIVPGVFQIEMARMAAEWTMGRRLSIREVRKSKFSRPLYPEEEIELSLELREQDGGWRVKARFSVEGVPAGESHLRVVAEEIANGK